MCKISIKILSTYYVSSAVPDAGDTVMRRISLVPALPEPVV